MKKGINCNFTQIEEFATEKEYVISELNNSEKEVVGESFIILRKESNDMTISFVLISANRNGFIYECIYSDL